MWFAFSILSLYGLGVIFVVVALCYLIVKRMEDKKKENFEKRNN